MNIFAIFAFINFLTSSALGVFVFFKNKKRHVNVSFSIFTLSIAVWSFGYFIWQISNTATGALFWSRFLMAGAIFTSLTYLHFTLVLVNAYEKRKTFIRLSYILSILFLLADLTPNFVNHVEPILGFKFWPMPGPLFPLFLVFWLFYAVTAIVVMANYFVHSKGVLKSQLRYILYATVIGYIGSVTNFLLWYKIPVLPVGNIAISVYVLVVTYAIIRYRLMDIRVMWRHVFMYFGLSAFLYGLFFFLVWIYQSLFGTVFTRSVYIVSIFVSPFIVFVIYRVIHSLERLANAYLFTKLYSYRETILHIAEELSHSTDIEIIADTIVDTLSAIGIDHVAIVDIDEKTGTIGKLDKLSGFNESEIKELTQCHRLVEYLDSNRKPLVKDEVNLFSVSARDGELVNSLNSIGISLCLPLIANKELTGIIVLGTKSSGNAYNNEDLELLNILSYQAGIAIENARLYKEVQDFNATLKQKVDEQTKDIKEKAEKLENLLKVKSEFIYLMSHQLRTPISVITGMSSMLKDGDLDSLPVEKQKEFFDGIFTKSKKLADILNDFIKAEEMDGEDFKLRPDDIKKMQLEDIVKEVCDDVSFEAKEKNISLTFVPPASLLPTITTDSHYLKQAVMNIIDNAIKYTQKGYVKVKVYAEKGNIVCEVSDSGIGIPEGDKPKLFDKFVRGKNAVDAYAYGTGLGLFIAKKIVEAHKGGTITFTSEQNKGTTFKTSIPSS